jgi:valyl-tRNA synthetase
VRTEEIFLPVGEIADPEAEREKLQKELTYTEGFLSSVEKKLSNERFVSNAKPEVVAMEQKKMQDAIQRIQVLKEQLEALV